MLNSNGIFGQNLDRECDDRIVILQLWHRWLIEIDDKNKMIYLQKNVTFIDVP